MILRLRTVLRILIALSMWASTPAASDVLNLPTSFVIHEKDLTMWLDDLASRITQSNTVISQELDFVQPFHSSLKTVSWQGSFLLKWTKKPNTNIWSFTGSLNSLTLYAKDLEVHDTFEISSGGATVNARVDLSCQNLAMTFPGGTTFEGELAVSWVKNALTPVLQNFQLQPSAKAPTVTVGACQGPSGVQGFLNEQLANLYKTPGKLQPMAASEIQRYVTQEANVLQAQLAKSYTFNFGKITGQFQGQTFSNLASGTWVIDGPAVLHSVKGSVSQTEKKDYTLSTLNDVGASGMVFSKSAFPDMLAFLRRAGAFDMAFTSKDVPGFASFRQSGIEEGFVWPDILNFSDSTVFPIQFSAASNPVLTDMKNQYPSVNLDVSSDVDFLMDAPTPHGAIPYVEFMSSKPAQAHVVFTPVNGAMKVDTTVKALPLKYAYRPEFFKIRRPTGGIDLSAITAAMKQSPASNSTTYHIPAGVTPVPGYIMGFQGTVFGAKTFRFDMNFKKQ